MSAFGLGWFTYFGPGEWEGEHASPGAGVPWDGAFHVEVARVLDAAGFDFVLFEDSLVVSEQHGGSRATCLATGTRAPRNDPAPLAAVIGAATEQLGVVVTLSTLAYPPFLLARLVSTLDSLCGGRFGWNIVTSSDQGEAHNLGLPALPPHEQRYAMAEEHLAAVGALLESWEADAVVMDRATHVHTDHTRVHQVDFTGRWYSTRGPLNTAPSPQRRPAYLQAGGSPAGRAFAARHADAVLAVANGPAAMREQRADLRARAAAAGRDPDELAVYFLVAPVLGASSAAARARLEEATASPAFLETTLMRFGAYTGVDFSAYPLDEPLPALSSQDSQGTLEKFTQPGSGKTLRRLAVEAGPNTSLELVGTPQQVADALHGAVEQGCADGFLITTPFHRLSLDYVREIAEDLVPLLHGRRAQDDTGGGGTATVRPGLRERLRSHAGAHDEVLLGA